MMWKDEDVREELLSISSEYSCDIFMTFQFLAAHHDDAAAVFTNYTTLVLVFIKAEGDLIRAK